MSDIQICLKNIEEIENEMLLEAMHIPNHTSVNTPVGNEDMNKVYYQNFTESELLEIKEKK